MSWKTALYNYVHAKNQAELEGSSAPLEALCLGQRLCTETGCQGAKAPEQLPRSRC